MTAVQGRGQWMLARVQAAKAEAAEAERRAREFRSTDEAELAALALRRRGFTVFRAAVVDGSADVWVVGSPKLTSAELVAKAGRVMARMKGLPPPMAPVEQPKEITAAPRNAPAHSQREDGMADRFRGLTEAEIRADMDLLVERWGSQKQAAAAAGIVMTTFSNTRLGHSRIGETVMRALYGAEGTALRPELQPETPPAGAGQGDAGSEAASPPGSTPPIAEGGGAGEEAPAPEPAAPEEPAELAPAEVRPWSKLEDADLVAILQGKLAGVQAEIAALEAEEQALAARRDALNRQGLDLELRADRLRATIAAFAPEPAEAA